MKTILWFLPNNSESPLAYKIQYKSSVKKDLKRLSKEEASKILNHIDNVLSIEAEKYPLLKGEYRGLRKFRVGNYRVIYSTSKQEVTVLKIGHRKDVYDN